ncbi:hypothetical protein RRG08_050253 [Elysia crispata]|uniref:Hexosyltransferase n=1 Tax=Elysia crispata TaxID=231223 RepID=A0AAE1B3S7_9GAST|nr:hypothetical protein RRG08_050253 [Elysia crispata]
MVLAAVVGLFLLQWLYPTWTYTTDDSIAYKHQIRMGTPKLNQGVEINKWHSSKPSQGVEIKKKHTPKPSQGVEINKSHTPKPSQDVEINKWHSPKPSQGVEIKKTHTPKPSQSVELKKLHTPKPSQGVEIVKISEEELLRRVNKHKFRVKLTSKVLLNDSYFLPSPNTTETYDNEVLLEPNTTRLDSHSVHFIIPSSPSDEKTRNAIRETWGSVSQNLTWPGKAISLPVKLTFVLGIQDNQNNSLPSPTKDKMESLDTKSIEDTEESQYDDIVQFDMIDSYGNLTRKILLAFKWVISSCKNVQYIVKADQDIFVNVPILLSFLKHHGNSNSVYGFIYDGGYASRVGKWKISKEAYSPNYYPVYASGNAYVVSKLAAQTLLNLSSHFPYVPIEDAFITGVLASVARVDRVHLNAFTYWREAKSQPCLFFDDKKFAGNNMTESDLRSAWQKQLENRGRKYCK